MEARFLFKKIPGAQSDVNFTYFFPAINSYDQSIHSFNSFDETDPSNMTVFQCFLFMCHPGCTQRYSSRNSMALSGSHFTLNCKGWLLRPAIRNIFPLTLYTSVSGPNGNVSSAPFDKQYSRRVSIFIMSANKNRVTVYVNNLAKILFLNN